MKMTSTAKGNGRVDLSRSTAASKRETTGIAVPPELPPPADKVAAEWVRKQRDEDRCAFMDQVETARQIARKYPQILSGALPKELINSWRRHLLRCGFDPRLGVLEVNDRCLAPDYERNLRKKSRGAVKSQKEYAATARERTVKSIALSCARTANAMEKVGCDPQDRKVILRIGLRYFDPRQAYDEDVAKVYKAVKTSD